MDYSTCSIFFRTLRKLGVSEMCPKFSLKIHSFTLNTLVKGEEDLFNILIKVILITLNSKVKGHQDLLIALPIYCVEAHIQLKGCNVKYGLQHEECTALTMCIHIIGTHHLNWICLRANW